MATKKKGLNVYVKNTFWGDNSFLWFIFIMMMNEAMILLIKLKQ